MVNTLSMSKINTFYVLTVKLADGKNYFCGLVLHMGQLVNEWDTDINYAKIYNNKLDAKKERSRLRKLTGSERCKIEPLNKFSKN